MVSPWSLSDSESPQVSTILADLYKAVVLVISMCPLIFKSSSPYTSLLLNVLRAPFTIGITVTFQFPGKVQVLIFTLFFQFVVSRYSPQLGKFSFLFFVAYY